MEPYSSDTDTDSDGERGEDVMERPSHAIHTEHEHSDVDIDDDTPLVELARRQRNAARSLTAANPKNDASAPFPTVLPSFEPLKMDSNRLTAKGRPNYYYFRAMSEHKPLDVFRKFIPLTMLQTIADNTNLYARTKNAGSGRRWKPVKWKDIQCFFGIVLYMGVYRCPRVPDYWDVSGKGPRHAITKAMSLVRFQQIKRFIHVCNPSSDNGRSFFFSKLEPLLGGINDASSRPWYPCSSVSVEEMMVMNYGRCQETVKMRNKPIGSGFKLWSLCDSGYMYTMFPHSNKQKWKDCAAYKNKLVHYSAVVAQLCDQLPRSVPFASSIYDQMYTVYMDNLFSTPRLFSLLRDKEIGAVGTVRSNATGFPKQLAVRGKKGKPMDWNTLGAAVCEDGKVLALTWIDNGAVQMLTTVHQLGDGHTIERLRKRPRLTSTNGPRVRKVFENRAVKKLKIPTVVDDYNYNMGGVDIADQLRAVYTSHLPSRRVWMPMLFWILDTVCTNSYKILMLLDQNWAGRHKSFKVDLAWAMVLDSTENDQVATRSLQQARATRDGVTRVQGRGLAESGGYVVDSNARNNVVVANFERHYPLRLSGDALRDCFNCRLKQKETPGDVNNNRRKTPFKCNACGLFLCITEARNCFMELHEKALSKNGN